MNEAEIEAEIERQSIIAKVSPKEPFPCHWCNETVEIGYLFYRCIYHGCKFCEGCAIGTHREFNKGDMPRCTKDLNGNIVVWGAKDCIWEKDGFNVIRKWGE